MGGNAAEAAHPDGTGQVIAIAFGGLGDGDAQQLANGVAAEIILAEGGAGVGLILVALGIQVHQGEIEVVNAGDLLLGAYQVVELDLYGLAGDQLRILGQDVAVGVDEVIADAPGGDDLVGGHAVLLDAENVAAGGQARNGDLAVFIHGNALAGEAVEGHLIGDGGAGHGNGAALLGREAVAGALGTHIEQDVVLGIQILLLVLGDVHGGTVDEGVGLDRGAVGAHGHHEHAGELRPDGAEVLAAHTLNEGHGVIGHLDDGGTRAVGGHGGQAGIVGVGGDGHHVAVAAVQAQHPIVRVGQGDLAVHEALDGLPAAQHVQLAALAGIHVQVALAVDVQVDVAQVIHVLVEAVDGGGGDIVIQVQVVPGHSQLLAAGEFAEGPVGDAVGMLGPQELLTAGLRQAEGGGHGVALGLLGNGLQEGIAIVAAEGAHPQGRAGGGGNGQVQGLGNGQREALGAAAHGLLVGHGGGDGQIARRLVADGGQGDLQAAALHKQAGGVGAAIGGGDAGLGLQVRAVGAGNGDVDGVILAFHPAAAVVGGIDGVGPDQGKHVLLIGLHGQHQGAVALTLGVVALHQIVAHGQLGVVHQTVAIGLNVHALQQVFVTLHAIGIGVDLDVRQLGIVQALEGDVHVALGRIALLGHGDGVGGGGDGGGPLGGRRLVAAADGQDGAVMDGHGLHPAIVGAVGGEIHLVVLVGGGGRHPDAGDALGQGQGVGGLV